MIEIKDKLWSSFVSLNETQTICIYYNKYFIYFNTFYDYLFYYQCALQTPTPNAEFTRRLYSVTTRPQRCHSVLSNTLWKRQAAAFVLSMFKINAAAWRSRRLHSVCTALLAFAQHAPRRSAFF